MIKYTHIRRLPQSNVINLPQLLGLSIKPLCPLIRGYIAFWACPISMPKIHIAVNYIQLPKIFLASIFVVDVDLILIGKLLSNLIISFLDGI